MTHKPCVVCRGPSPSVCMFCSIDCLVEFEELMCTQVELARRYFENTAGVVGVPIAPDSEGEF